ncbi:MAG: hypothetical protein LUG52_08340 [Clostridia bacterium]|nr:hypothetical protein [Clostridia bacterium]
MFTIENNTISVTKGDSGFIAISVKNPDGTDYELRDDDTLVFSVRKKLSSGEVVLRKEGAEFEFSP